MQVDTMFQQLLNSV